MSAATATLAAPPAWRTRLRGLVVECQTSPCRRFTVAHRLLRQDGIRLDGAWHCSEACLEQALLGRLRTVASVTRGRSVRAGRIPFHHILLRNGVLTDAQLREALRAAAQRECPLEQVLLAENMATTEQTAAARAEEVGVPLVSRAACAVHPAVQLPRALMQRYRAATVSDAGGTLLIGFAGAIDRQLLSAASQVTGMDTRACIIPEPVFDRQSLSATVPDSCMQETAAEDACSALVAAALREGAEQVRLGAGPGWVWARLEGRRRTDHIFAMNPEVGGTFPEKNLGAL